jgi:Uncharacterized protein conserved in bacteria (DUF2252)
MSGVIHKRRMTSRSDLCGWALARAHARASGNAREIAAYLGASDLGGGWFSVLGAWCGFSEPTELAV